MCSLRVCSRVPLFMKATFCPSGACVGNRLLTGLMAPTPPTVVQPDRTDVHPPSSNHNDSKLLFLISRGAGSLVGEAASKGSEPAIKRAKIAASSKKRLLIRMTLLATDNFKG